MSERFADLPRECRQPLDLIQAKIEAVLFYEEEPVAAPGDIAVHHPVSRNLDRHMRAMAIRLHVAHRYFAVFGQPETDRPHRRFQQVFAWADASQPRQCGGHPDRPVPAHAEIAHVVEEDHARRRPGTFRLEQQRPHQHVGTPRFAQNGAPVPIVLGAELLQSRNHGS
jgi:hypothetical protein